MKNYSLVHKTEDGDLFDQFGSFNPFLHKFLFMNENLGIFFSAVIKVKESFFDQ